MMERKNCKILLYVSMHVLHLSLISSVDGAFSKMYIKLIEDFFDSTGLSNAVSFSCGDEDYDLIRKLSEKEKPIFTRIMNPRGSDQNISVEFTHTLENVQYPLGIVIDMFCPQSWALLVETMPGKFFGETYKWILFWSKGSPNNISIDTLFERFSFVQIRLDSQMLIAVEISSETLLLLEVYREDHDKLKAIPLGKWSVGDKMINLMSQAYVYNGLRRGNLNGKVLRVAVARLNPHYNFSNLTQVTGYRPHDATANLFLAMYRMLNFRYKLVITDKIAGISKSGDEGLTGILRRGEADIASTIMAVIPKMAELVDFIHPLGHMQPIAYFLQPSGRSLKNEIFLPFSTSVWFCLVITVVLVVIVLKTITDLTEIQNSPSSWNTSEVALFAVAIVTLQSAEKMPSSSSARIAITAFLITVIILYNIYSGLVVSLLSTRSTPISSIDDLIQYNFQLRIAAYPYLDRYFENASDKSIQTLGKTRKIMSPHEGVKAMRSGLFCYCDTYWAILSETNRQLSLEQHCDLDYFHIPHSSVQLSKTLPFNSQYRELFNWCSLRLQEAGLVKYEFRYKIKDENCFNPSFVSLEISGLYPAFTILEGGLIAALIILVFEIAVFARSACKITRGEPFTSIRKGRVRVQRLHRVHWSQV